MALPIGRLFRTLNCAYFYDAVMHEIIPISEESACCLDTWFNSSICPPLTDELSELLSRGYFSSTSPVAQIEHPYTTFLPLLLDRKLDHITLQVTQNCNLRCKYCVYSVGDGEKQRHHSNHRMTWQTAKDAIDFLWLHSIDSPKISIGFYGGEPLLEFELVKKIVEYSRQRFYGKEIQFNITSNGVLLNDEIIHYFAKNNITLMISLDGPKVIHDQNRVFPNGEGTFDTVMKHVEHIHKIEPEYAKTVSFSMVINPENDFDCMNEINIECSSLSLGNLHAAFVETLYDKEEKVFEDSFLSKYFYQEFLAWLGYFGRYSSEKVSPIAFQYLLHELGIISKNEESHALKPIDCPSGPCVAGRQRLFCDVKGNLFPCERVNECSEAMMIGSIYNGIDYDATVKLMNVGQLTADKCKQCWAFRYCTLCAKKADTGAKNLNGEEKLKHCPEAFAAAYSGLKSIILMHELRTFYPDQLVQGGDYL